MLTIKRRRFLIGIFVAIGVGVLCCLALSADLLHGLQQRSSDLLFRAAYLQTESKPAANISIIAIDDKSLQELGHFSSWPRSHHAQLIENLINSRVRVIVFDILFAETTAEDVQLAAAIKKAGNVVLPYAYPVNTQSISLTGGTITLGIPVLPVTIFQENALAMGHANMLPDEDGVVRRLPLLIPHEESPNPALSLAAVAEFLRRPKIVESPVKDGVLLFAGRSIPLTGNNMLLNYLNDGTYPLSFQTVSYVDVLNNRADLSRLDDNIVIIGISSTGLGDTFWTPQGKMVYGVELHASAINTILTASFLKQKSLLFTVTTIMLLTLLCGIMALRFRILWAITAASGIIVVYLLISFVFFDRGIIFNIVYPPLAVAGTFMGVNLYNLISERAEKREITRTFGRYVSPSVVEEILVAAEEGELRLGGEEVAMTVMFADGRDFTGIAENIPTPELIRMLNRYLSLIIHAVLKHDGMVNKFGGDSIMAVWNVPLPTEPHALKAVKAALDAQQAINELQAGEPSLPRMQFGIGINTGQAVAGNMGSLDRLEYSVIGDAVNTAARLADSVPGDKIWIGENTFRQVEDYVKATPLAPMKMKGKQQPIQAYEVNALADATTGTPD
ncbi:CHASE2 domain-containing protein [Chloroflexota bacterium]